MADQEAENERLLAAKKKYEELKKQQKKKNKKNKKKETVEEDSNEPAKDAHDDESKEEAIETQGSEPKSDETQDVEAENAEPELSKSEPKESIEPEPKSAPEPEPTEPEPKESTESETKKSPEAETKEPVETHDETSEGSHRLSLALEEQEKDAVRASLHEHDQESMVSDLERENKFLADRVREIEAENAQLKLTIQELRSQLDEYDDRMLDRHDYGAFEASSGGSAAGRDRAPSYGHRPGQRSRHSSFIDVDMSGEAGKISDNKRQMEQWRGWQIDMRGWRNVRLNTQIVL